MNQKTTRFLLVALTMLLCFLCTACGDSKISESVKRPESSTISPQNDPNEGLGGDMHNEDIVDEVGLYEGLWLSEVTDQYDYLEIDADGNWQLFSDGYVLDEGYLWYDPEWDTTFVYSTLDGFMDGGCIELEGDQIYIDVCGYFDYLDGRGGQWQGAGGSNWDGEYREDEVYHQDISVFEGTWYYDNDLSAETFIIIDAYGNWSFYQRTPGDPEATEMDYGTFSYDTEETAAYYANSSLYDGMWYQMYDFDEGVFLWDGDTYYRMEDEWYSDSGNGNEYYSWNAELCQRNVSEFEGVWYCNGDLSAETFIVIDAYGNWSFYQRTPGDPEATEMDYGTFSYSADEVSVYYADSAVYDGVSYWVFELGDNTFFWGEETYDRLEW